MLDFARQWQAAEKIVYSKTLGGARSARTRIEREYDHSAATLATSSLKPTGPGNPVNTYLSFTPCENQ